MGKATISLTDSNTGWRCVLVWMNITYVGKASSADNSDTMIQLVNYRIAYVRESVAEVEQAIEQAARND